MFRPQRAVTYSAELQRIHALPKREYTAEQVQSYVRRLSEILSTPNGTQTLRPIQAIALLEIGMYGGLLGPIRVGEGKTLISFLSPVVLQSWRPLLLVPAHLVEKTRRDLKSYAEHWRIPNFIRIESYQLLGRSQAATMLDDYRPDLVICDEAHRLKNRKAAVAKRVRRYFREHSTAHMVAISGTITKRSIRDYVEVARCALKQNAPVPLVAGDVDEWADALDEKINPLKRVHPGCLRRFFSLEDKEIAKTDPTRAARLAFNRRLTSTPGVVASSDDQGTLVDCSLSISTVTTDMKPATDEAFRKLREHWVTPDGWEISDPMTLWRHAFELALGFYYVWDPRPPDWWIEPRQEWSKVCRKILSHSQKFDSEGQLAIEIRKGHLICPEYGRWMEVRERFQPNTRAVWIDDSVLNFAENWLTENGNRGIIWSNHTAFSKALEGLGCRFYGRKGLTSRGEFIDDYRGQSGIVVSIAANCEGRNLQRYDRNLIVSPPTDGARWEQLLGRTHRPGQESDEVTCEVLCTCKEHAGAVEQALKDAQYIQDTTGQAQKLVFADRNLITLWDLKSREGARWE